LTHDQFLSRRAALFGGMCLCCMPTLLRAQATGAPQPAPTVEVSPGIHVRRGVSEDATAANRDAIANLAFIVGRDAVAVIDPGGSLHDGQSLRLAIRAITQLPIRYVVLSHVHPDHIFGAAAFKDDGAGFVGHASLPEQLAARGEFYRRGLEKILGDGQAESVVVPTHLVRDRDELDLGGRVLALTAHKPAHTMGDLSVLDRQSGILLAGDLLFVERIPVLDGNLKGWLAELAALRASGVQQAVPGHGPALVSWATAEAAQRRYLTVLLDETRAAIAKNVPIEDASTSVAQGERGNWQLFDAYNGRNVIEAYRRLEWE
jgi:quinoprotein relay system zinc metallohydrolase 2